VYAIYCCGESESYRVVGEVKRIEVGADEKLYRDAPFSAAAKELGAFYASCNNADAEKSAANAPGTHTPQQPD